MLENFDHNVTVESVMNTPDRKKTPAFVDKLNEEESGNGGSGDKKERGERKSAVERDVARKQMDDSTKESRDGKSEENALEEDLEGSGWETAGKKKSNEGQPKGQHWGQHRGQHRGQPRGSGAWRGGHHGHDAKGGSPRRYNDHPSTRGQPRGNGPHEMIHSDHDKHKSSKRTSSPANRSPEKSVKDKSDQRRDVRAKDRNLQDARSASSSPKRGRVSGPSGPASPNRGSEQRWNKRTDRGGKVSQSKSPPKPGGRSHYDEAISFLESGGGLSGDSVSKLKVDIKASDSVTEKGKRENFHVKGGNQNNGEWVDGKPWETVPGKRTKVNDGHVSQRPEGRRSEAGVLKTNTGQTSNPPVQHVKPLTREEQHETILSVDSQNVESHIQVKAFGTDQREIMSENGAFAQWFSNKTYIWNDSSMDWETPPAVKETDKRNTLASDKDNLLLQNAGNTGGRMPEHGDDMAKTLKDTQHTGNLSTVDEIHGQTGEEPKKQKQDVSKDEIADPVSCAAPGIHSSREDPTSAEKHGHGVSPRSAQSSRSTTPMGRNPFRRPSGGNKSTRRLAAVFTSPTTPETSAPDADWSKNDPSRSIPKSTFPVTVQAIFPQQAVTDHSTLTEPQDFAVLQRIADGTMDVSDLPVGFLLMSAKFPYKMFEERAGAEQPTSRETSPIPHAVKLHKSCMTEEVVQETHSDDDKLSMMQLCFPATHATDLQNILETCGGDVQWATNILLDSLAQAGPPESTIEEPTDLTSNERTPGNISSNRSSPLMSERCIIEEDISRTSVNDSQEEHTERIETNQENAHANANTPDESQHVGKVNERTDPISDFILTLENDLEEGDKPDAESVKLLAESKQASNLASNIVPKEDDDFAEGGDKENFMKLDEVEMVPHPVNTLQSGSTKENDSEIKTVESDLSKDAVNDPVNEIKVNHGDLDSVEFEEFSNNFTSGKSEILSKNVRGSASCTTDDEMPALESFSVDRQLIELATAVEKVGFGDSQVGDGHNVEESPAVATEATMDLVSQPAEKVPSSDNQLEASASSETPVLQNSLIDSDRNQTHISSESKECLPEVDTEQFGDKEEGSVVEEQKSTIEVAPTLTSADNAVIPNPDQHVDTGRLPVSEMGAEDTGHEPGPGDEREKSFLDEGSETTEVLPIHAAADMSVSQPEMDQKDITTRLPEPIEVSDGIELPQGPEEKTRAGDSEDVNICTETKQEAKKLGASSPSGICDVKEIDTSAEAGTEGVSASHGVDDMEGKDVPDLSATHHKEDVKESSSDSIPSLKKVSSDSESTENEVPDGDIPWKSELLSTTSRTLESTHKEDAEKRESGVIESGEAVYEYLGGMVLQMDPAFALQLMEIFGPVGFHLRPGKFHQFVINGKLRIVTLAVFEEIV